jgi:hypothetical protein
MRASRARCSTAVDTTVTEETDVALDEDEDIDFDVQIKGDVGPDSINWQSRMYKPINGGVHPVYGRCTQDDVSSVHKMT